MADFKHIEPPYQLEAYFSKYPQGYTIYEALLKWTEQVNTMIDDNNIMVENYLTLTQTYQTLITNIESLFTDKADKNYTDAQLLLKADETDVTASLLLKADKTYTDAQLLLKANKVQEAWITATLLNSYIGTLKYRENSIGQIEIEGSVSLGTSGQPACVINPIYAPQIARRFTSVVNGAFGNLLIATDGTITPNQTGTWHINIRYIRNAL